MDPERDTFAARVWIETDLHSHLCQSRRHTHRCYTELCPVLLLVESFHHLTFDIWNILGKAGSELCNRCRACQGLDHLAKALYRLIGELGVA